MADLTAAIEQFLQAEGLSARCAVIEAHAGLLLSEEAQQHVAALAQADPPPVFAPELCAGLLGFCRKEGIEAGANSFAKALINLWLDQDELEAKAALMTHWPDPILSDAALHGLAAAAVWEQAPQAAAKLRWHHRFLITCREHGVGAGLEIVHYRPKLWSQDERSDQKNYTNLQELMGELLEIIGDLSVESLLHRINICSILSENIRRDGTNEFLSTRAWILNLLGKDTARAISIGVISREKVDFERRRAHSAFDESLSILRNLPGYRIDLAITARNWANLFTDEYKLGWPGAAEEAHLLFEESLTVSRSLSDHKAEAAITALDWGILHAAEYRNGKAGANKKAHELYEEALAIERSPEGNKVNLARISNNQAALYASEYESNGNEYFCERAHFFFQEAIKIWRVLPNRDADTALTAQNWANLYQFEYQMGKASAAVKAHTLYEEALKIWRGLQAHRGDVAMTAQNWAILFWRECKAGKAAAAERGHELFDVALAIWRDLPDCEAKEATTLQNWANLYATEYSQGNVEAGTKAHLLYRRALSLNRRLAGREIELAMTAQNWAGLYGKGAKDVSSWAAKKSCYLYEFSINIYRKSTVHRIDLITIMKNYAALILYKFHTANEECINRSCTMLDEAEMYITYTTPMIITFSIFRVRMYILEIQKSWYNASILSEEMMSRARKRLLDIADRASRNRLLTEIAGIGRRGAAAALRLGDVEWAVRLLEAGRAQQLGALLREAEAELPPDDRAALDAARLAYGEAEQGLQRAGSKEARDAAEVRLEETHAALQALKARIGLDDLDVTPPSPAALRAALGDAVPVQLAYGDAGGFLLMLVPGEDDWRVIEAPGLSSGAVDATVNDYFVQLNAFQNPPKPQNAPEETTGPVADDPAGGSGEAGLDTASSAEGRFDDGDTNDALPAMRGEAAGADRDPDLLSENRVDLFSEALDARLGRNTAVPGVAGIWELIAGPLHAALGAAGIAPARGAALAPEIVLCLPADIAMLPISAARNPDTGTAFFEDYAMRLVPSLGALMSAAARARRPIPRSAVLVTDPLDDLDWRAYGNPAGHLFDAATSVHLTGYRYEPRTRTVATWDGLANAVEQSRPGYVLYFGHSDWDQHDAEGSAICLAAPLDPQTGTIPQDIIWTRRGRLSRTVPDLVTPARLRGLRLSSTRLVFSASCRGAGLSLGVARDEMGGLPAAWLEAGAAGMISSLYTVFTVPAAIVMRSVLEHMIERGLPPVQALRQAQMRLPALLDEARQMQMSHTSSDSDHSVPMKAGTSYAPVPAVVGWRPTAHVAAFVLHGT